MAFTTFGKRRVYKPTFQIKNRNRKAQTTNKPVMKKMKPPAKKEKTVDGRQTNAIMTLSKQVRSLQLSKYGLVQNNRQLAIFTYNPSISEGQFPLQDKPIAFLMQNLENNQRVYEGTITPIPGSTFSDAGYATTTNFTVPQQVNNLSNQWQWNRHDRQSNTDIRVGYLPLARYFEIRTSIEPDANLSLLKPARINIKLIKMRPSTYRTQSSNLQYNLPNALGAYGNLLVRPTVTNNFTRNYLNKEIHEVLFNKDIYITPKNQASFTTDTPGTGRRQYCYTHRFKYTFKPKFIKSAVDIPEEDSSAMWTHIPVHDQVWCLISSDCDQDYLTRLTAKMSISSHNYWRDNVGTEGV